MAPSASTNIPFPSACCSFDNRWDCSSPAQPAQPFLPLPRCLSRSSLHTRWDHSAPLQPLLVSPAQHPPTLPGAPIMRASIGTHSFNDSAEGCRAEVQKASPCMELSRDKDWQCPSFWRGDSWRKSQNRGHETRNSSLARAGLLSSACSQAPAKGFLIEEQEAWNTTVWQLQVWLEQG